MSFVRLNQGVRQIKIFPGLIIDFDMEMGWDEEGIRMWKVR
jgi:hypothetical protein